MSRAPRTSCACATCSKSKVNKALFTVYVMKGDLKRCGTTGIAATPSDSGSSGMTGPCEAASSRPRHLLATSKATCQASSRTADGPWGPTWSRASTTRSKSSSAGPTASAMTTTSSSSSGQRSPEIGDEPIFSPVTHSALRPWGAVNGQGGNKRRSCGIFRSAERGLCSMGSQASEK